MNYMVYNYIQKGGDNMADNKEALQELLELIAKHPDLADRITITIKPKKVLQGTDKPK